MAGGAESSPGGWMGGDQNRSSTSITHSSRSVPGMWLGRWLEGRRPETKFYFDPSWCSPGGRMGGDPNRSSTSIPFVAHSPESLIIASCFEMGQSASHSHASLSSLLLSLQPLLRVLTWLRLSKSVSGSKSSMAVFHGRILDGFLDAEVLRASYSRSSKKERNISWVARKVQMDVFVAEEEWETTSATEEEEGMEQPRAPENDSSQDGGSKS
ncbi:hypothetical protein PG984_006962 [Apiospora sp. TS-2023a]